MQITNGVVQHLVLAADVDVYRDDIPRGHQEIVEVGEGGPDEGIEQIYLGLIRKSVDRLGLDPVRDVIEADTLLLVELVP